MYTPEQTAQMLNIATSTLRKYSRLFSTFLSQPANRPQRKYQESDIATLQRVVQLRSDGVSLEDIPAQLATVQPEEVKPENSLALIPAIATEFQSLHDQISQLQTDQESREKRLQDQIDQLKDELQAQKIPWWKKLRKK